MIVMFIMYSLNMVVRLFMFVDEFEFFGWVLYVIYDSQMFWVVIIEVDIEIFDGVFWYWVVVVLDLQYKVYLGKDIIVVE